MTAVVPRLISKSYEACTGCGTCAACCPADAISMCPDSEGFLRPEINADLCTGCHLCLKLCPVSTNAQQQEASRKEPQSVFAAWHLDEDVRRKSSSGGVFTALAENVHAQGGVVVGAAFEPGLVVRHVLAENTADLERMRGSKYVQSEVSSALFRQIRLLLKQGRPVLFTGTPCQIAGVHSYLGKTRGELFTCDIACHGVPSPKLFARYVEEIKLKSGEVTNLSFRDKTIGWKNFGVLKTCVAGKSEFTPASSDSYMLAFLRDYALRPSCYICPYANTVRPGDLTLADFWGVVAKYPEYDRDDKGTSLILVNTEKGKLWLDACRQTLFLGPADLETAIAGNPILKQSTLHKPERHIFYHDLEELSYDALIAKYRLYPPPFTQRMGTLLARIARKVVRLLARTIPTTEPTA